MGFDLGPAGKRGRAKPVEDDAGKDGQGHFIPAWLRPKTDIPRLANGLWLRPVKRREGIFENGDKDRGLSGGGTVHFTEVAERVWLLELTDFEVLNPRGADLWLYLCPRVPKNEINDRFLGPSVPGAHCGSKG